MPDDDSQPPSVSLTTSSIRRFSPSGLGVTEQDEVVVEEPIEIRYAGESVATVMRTPGDERELAMGYLFVEGWIQRREDIAGIDVVREGPPGHVNSRTIADLRPAAGAPPPAADVTRRTNASTSSCGICGKGSAEEAMLLRSPPVAARKLDLGSVPGGWLGSLPDQLREHQALFSATGALHAAGLFRLGGEGGKPGEPCEVIAVREDIGRHNATDEVIGYALQQGLLPLDRHVLQVSGRVSFEIVQKAFRAGIPVLCAVSGVSSLAITCAESAGILLVGFSRKGEFAAYSHSEFLEGS